MLQKGDQVAAVQGQLGRGEVEAYESGFESQLKAKGITVVAKPSSKWSRQTAYSLAQQLLTKYPNLKGLYCHNDDTTVGCVQALKQAGKKPGQIRLVTLNGSPTGAETIKQGWPRPTSRQPPPLESALAVRPRTDHRRQKVTYRIPATHRSRSTPGNINHLPLVTTWLAVHGEHRRRSPGKLREQRQVGLAADVGCRGQRRARRATRSNVAESTWVAYSRRSTPRAKRRSTMNRSGSHAGVPLHAMWQRVSVGLNRLRRRRHEYWRPSGRSSAVRADSYSNRTKAIRMRVS